MLATAWIPLLVIPAVFDVFHIDPVGFVMAWGLAVALPLTVVAGFTLFGSIFALIFGAKDRENSN